MINVIPKYTKDQARAYQMQTFLNLLNKKCIIIDPTGKLSEEGRLIDQLPAPFTKAGKLIADKFKDLEVIENEWDSVFSNLDID